MKIGIDVFSFDKPGENYGVGPGVYVWHLLPELFKTGTDHTFYVFANQDNAHMIPRMNNVIVVESKLPNKTRPVRIIHEQINVVYYSIKYGLDKVHFLGNNISFLISKKSIITVYDLMWKYYWDRGDRSLKYFYTLLTVPNTIRKAESIITISNFIAEELRDVYGRKHNVYPVLLAPCKLFSVTEEVSNSFREKYSYDFIFTVTTSMPHKNLITLLKSLALLKKNGALGFKLIVAGQMRGLFHLENESFIRLNGLEKDVILAGFISEEEKSYLYRNAKFVVYPSLYEGFGLPLLESMSVGTPVISSNAASMPEVGGEACLYFNPDSVDDLAILIDNTWKNEKQLSDLAETGLNQYKKFNWKNVAMETMKVYEGHKNY